MSRIYDNQPLASLPVNNVPWLSEWNESEFIRNGKGIILECIIKKLSKIAITDTCKQKFRYLLLHIELLKSHNRQFDEKGNEIEPNFSETEKLRTGYLNSSYKVVAKGTSDQLSTADVIKRIKLAQLLEIQKDSSESQCCTLWLSEEHYELVEVNNGDKLRIKTKADSPFIDSITKIDKDTSKVCNYAGGEQVGSSWTDKVMQVKEQISNVDQEDIVHDDEWDD